jgi:hypothetical protein
MVGRDHSTQRSHLKHRLQRARVEEDELARDVSLLDAQTAPGQPLRLRLQRPEHFTVERRGQRAGAGSTHRRAE